MDFSDNGSLKSICRSELFCSINNLTGKVSPTMPLLVFCPQN
jgi:hypothetical protein